MFLPAVLIPVCALSSLAFHMMYSACKINKQGDNIQSWHTPFPIFNQSGIPCPVLTVASWPAYRFLRRQVRWSSIPISWRIFHSLLWSTQSKVLVSSMKQIFFLEFSCFFYDPTDVGNLMSGPSAFSLTLSYSLLSHTFSLTKVSSCMIGKDRDYVTLRWQDSQVPLPCWSARS